MGKALIHKEVVFEVERRISQLNDLLKDAFQSTADETKSSAGDKHETGRAMAQLEQEKIGGQLNEMEKLRSVLKRIQPEISHSVIQSGSLVQTNLGWFYLSVGIGLMNIGKIQIFCMTPAAPLGKILSGKKVNDQVEWNGKSLEIQSVS